MIDKVNWNDICLSNMIDFVNSLLCDSYWLNLDVRKMAWKELFKEGKMGSNVDTRERRLTWSRMILIYHSVLHYRIDCDMAFVA